MVVVRVVVVFRLVAELLESGQGVAASASTTLSTASPVAVGGRRRTAASAIGSRGQTLEHRRQRT